MVPSVNPVIHKINVH